MNILEDKPRTDLSEAIVQELSTPLLVIDRELRLRFSNAAARGRFRQTDQDDAATIEARIAEALRSDSRIAQMATIAAGAAREFLLRPSFEESEECVTYAFKRLRAAAPEDGLVMIAIRSAHRAAVQVREANEESRREKEAALEARRQARELARVNQNLNRFAGAAAHDMQEPVRIISMLSDALLNEGPSLPPERQQRFLDRIGRQARRARRIVTDILEFSEVRDADLDLDEVDVAAIAEAVWRGFEDEVEPPLTARADIPELGSAVCDRKMLEVVLRNLMSNSIKYRRADVVRIALSSRRTDNYYELRYRDHGQGFAAEQAETIFEPFTRLRREDEVEGTGVGLALCRSIMERHQGRIWAVGRPGEGADFFIRLPLRAPHALI